MLRIGIVMGCSVGASGWLVWCNVINTVSEPVSVCLLEWNISVLTYFGVPLHTILGYIYFYKYIYIYICIIDNKKNKIKKLVCF